MALLPFLSRSLLYWWKGKCLFLKPHQTPGNQIGQLGIIGGRGVASCPFKSSAFMPFSREEVKPGFNSLRRTWTSGGQGCWDHKLKSVIWLMVIIQQWTRDGRCILRNSEKSSLKVYAIQATWNTFYNICIWDITISNPKIESERCTSMDKRVLLVSDFWQGQMVFLSPPSSLSSALADHRWHLEDQ